MSRNAPADSAAIDSAVGTAAIDSAVGTAAIDSAVGTAATLDSILRSYDTGTRVCALALANFIRGHKNDYRDRDTRAAAVRALRARKQFGSVAAILPIVYFLSDPTILETVYSLATGEAYPG